VRRCDDGVGTILESLEKSGEAENTIVVFMSDHGISNPFSKMNCYQVSLRVPLIVRYPGKIEAGRRDKFNMVSAVDLAPTLLELAGLDVPATMAGRSFTPLLEGHPQDGRDHVIGYYYRNLRQTKMYPEFAVHMRDWVYIYNPWVDGVTEVHNSDYTGSPTLLAMWKAAESVPSIKKRTNFHKYRIREELYNVRQDPHAYINVAPAPENRVRIAEMQAILVNWMEETDHPALDLMKDPHNEKLISEYMEWERLNAVKQVEEVKRGKR
jgi:N-sulfoglucosamine sulfohydrolase